jgi:hypothetical protein
MLRVIKKFAQNIISIKLLSGAHAFQQYKENHQGYIDLTNEIFLKYQR